MRLMTKLVTGTLLCCAAWAQVTKPEFEVASVKTAIPRGPNGQRTDRNGGPGTSDPTLYTCRNCPLAWVIHEAYNLKPHEFQGPGWLSDTRFDIQARVPPGTTKLAFRQMLQRLLAERFRLSVHREPKNTEVYELSVAKNGPKFREAVPPAEVAPVREEPAPVKRDADGFPILGPRMSMAVVPGYARLRSENQPISWFAEMLSAQLRGPVIDLTNLTGKYDFVVSWAFGEQTAASAPGEAAPAARVDHYRPALIHAVQSQLGLKLERRTGSVDVLIVDHAEKTPTAN